MKLLLHWRGLSVCFIGEACQLRVNYRKNPLALSRDLFGPGLRMGGRFVKGPPDDQGEASGTPGTPGMGRH